MNAAALAAVRADAAHRHGRARSWRVEAFEYSVGDAGRAVERVAVGGAVELHRLADDARARRARRVDPQVGVGQRRAGVGQPEQAGELLVRPHRDQVAAAVDPRA